MAEYGTGFGKQMLMIILSIILIWAFFGIAMRKPSLVPSRVQWIAESGYAFVRNGIGRDILGEKHFRQWVPLLFAPFFFVLLHNLFCSIPLYQLTPSFATVLFATSSAKTTSASGFPCCSPLFSLCCSISCSARFHCCSCRPSLTQEQRMPSRSLCISCGSASVFVTTASNTSSLQSFLKVSQAGFCRCWCPWRSSRTLSFGRSRTPCVSWRPCLLGT